MVNSVSHHLKNTSIFTLLDDIDLQAIEKYLSFKRAEPGDTIFNEGERGDFVCFLVIGEFQVIKKINKNHYAMIHRLSPGDSIGEMALIDNLTRSATVKAVDHSGYLVLTRHGFENILRLYPDIGIKLLKGLASFLSLNLRKTSEKLADFMPKPYAT